MLILTDIQKVSLAITPKSAAGNPTAVENVRWSSSDEAVATVAPSDDGLSAVVTTTGALGTVQVSVTADAKIGDEVKDITGVLDIEVKASNAVSLEVSAGVPEDK